MNINKDYIQDILCKCNIEFNENFQNRLSDLDNAMIEINSIQNSVEIESLKNKIRCEKFKLKYLQYFELIKQNSKFKDIHKGKRCFVLGNGPSLKMQDLSLLENEYTFTVNNLMRFPDFNKIKTNYHFYADPAYFNLTNKNHEMNILRENFLNDLKALNTPNNNPICFLSTLGYDFCNTYNLSTFANIEFYSTPLRFYDGYNDEIDYSKPSPAFNTVVHWAITMAIYMGFSEIYLLGCDTTGIVEMINYANVHAIDYGKDREKFVTYINELYGIEEIFKGWTAIIHSYKQLYDYCCKKNIKLINCSAETILDSIPRASYEIIIKQDY